MRLKAFSSKGTERPSQPRLSARPTTREFEKLRQQASLLHEEARQVRSQLRDLRTQLQAVVADFHRERGLLAENGLCWNGGNLCRSPVKQESNRTVLLQALNLAEMRRSENRCRSGSYQVGA
jgi:hypothetical protein